MQVVRASGKVNTSANTRKHELLPSTPAGSLNKLHSAGQGADTDGDGLAVAVGEMLGDGRASGARARVRGRDGELDRVALRVALRLEDVLRDGDGALLPARDVLRLLEGERVGECVLEVVRDALRLVDGGRVDGGASGCMRRPGCTPRRSLSTMHSTLSVDGTRGLDLCLRTPPAAPRPRSVTRRRTHTRSGNVTDVSLVHST